MVQITRHIPLKPDESVDIDKWLMQLKWHYPGKAYQVIEQALTWAKDKGDFVLPEVSLTAYQQGIEIAAVLADFNIDHNAIVASLLFPLFDQQVVTQEAIKATFGREITQLLTGVQQVKALQLLPYGQAKPLTENKVIGLRKMLLAMINDVRIVLVKLAERLCSLREAVKGTDCHAIADVVLAIYAPLANRLGVTQIKWELEDLAFRCQHPKAYKTITRALDERRIGREQYIEDFIHHLHKVLQKDDIAAEVAGRVKHIYSIWRKMQRKQVDFDHLFDLRAVRILVPEVRDCYKVLSLIHARWLSIPEEFDDYIASPKSNGYRSIHTVIQGPGQKYIEVQIRTVSMHQDSEMGVAAHWRYKEGTIDTSLDNRIYWLRSLLAWQRELGARHDDLETLQSQLVDDRVYVFAPDGAVFDLPDGATPLDFAYLIHTDVGHRCRGAKVNGKIVPLTYHLHTGERIEITTQKVSRPSRDWLSEHEGYLKTSRARAKVAQWFRQQDREGNIQAGKELITKAARKLKITEVDHEQLVKFFKKHSLEELYIHLGLGEIKWQSLLSHLEQNYGVKKAVVTAQPDTIPTFKKTPESNRHNAPLMIAGVDNLLVRMAGCCKPVEGDAVVGYITQGRGVTVHRESCKQVAAMRAKWPDKIITVQWHHDPAHQHKFIVDLCLIAHHSDGLFRDVTATLSHEKILIVAMRAQQNRQYDSDKISLTIEVDSNNTLKKVIMRLEQVSGVRQVQRI